MTEQAFTVQQFASAYKVGRTKAFHEISTGRLATYKVGQRRYISARAAVAWQTGLEHETAGALSHGSTEAGAT